jgi:glycosyltransferase involved in cell wall biosynthesis
LLKEEARMPGSDVSVIIPACNEGQSIGMLVRKVRSLYPSYEVIVVNDGSTDDTAEVARESGAIVYSHPYNVGNGAAVKSGMRIASGEIFVLMDGDGQHDPEDIARMVELLPEYDLVVGARPAGQQSSIMRGLGNRLLNRLASYVAKFPIQDLTSGFRAVKADVARKFLYLLPNTYSYPTSLTLGVLREGWCVKCLPIRTPPRREGRSQLRILRTGAKFIMITTKVCTLYSPLRIFLPVSFFTFLLGIGYYIFTFVTMGRFTNMSALLLTTAVIIFMMGLVSEQITQMRFEANQRD